MELSFEMIPEDSDMSYPSVSRFLQWNGKFGGSKNATLNSKHLRLTIYSYLTPEIMVSKIAFLNKFERNLALSKSYILGYRNAKLEVKVPQSCWLHKNRLERHPLYSVQKQTWL